MTGIGRFGIVFAFFLPSVICSGCGGTTPRTERLVPAAGTVKLDGRPTSGIRLYFTPISGTKGVGGCAAITDDEGKFTVIHSSKKEGIPPGKYEVLISRKVKPDGTPLDDSESPTMVQAIESIAQRYSDPSKAGLHNTVEITDKGVTNIDFQVSRIQLKKK